MIENLEMRRSKDKGHNTVYGINRGLRGLGMCNLVKCVVACVSHDAPLLTNEMKPNRDEQDGVTGVVNSRSSKERCILHENQCPEHKWEASRHASHHK